MKFVFIYYEINRFQIVRVILFSQISTKLQKNALEVINSTMEKVWTSGEDDGFTFLINMMKKSVISVNYKVGRLHLIL